MRLMKDYHQPPYELVATLDFALGVQQVPQSENQKAELDDYKWCK